jgi:hypothetical protein
MLIRFFIRFYCELLLRMPRVEYDGIGTSLPAESADGAAR